MNNLQILWLSLQVATLATVFILPLGTFLGWLFSRKSFPGKLFVDGFVHIPLVLPPVVTGYFLLVLFGPSGFFGMYLNQWFGVRIAFTKTAAIIAAGVVSLPLLVRAVRVAIDAVDLKLEEAARLLRTGEWGIFFKITLPLAANGIVAGAVLAFARALGEFGATIIFASNIAGKTRTMPLAIFTYLNQPEGEEKAKILVIFSIILSYVSILLNELLLKKIRHAQD